MQTNFATYDGWRDDLWVVIAGGAPNQAALDAARTRLRHALDGSQVGTSAKSTPESIDLLVIFDDDGGVKRTVIYDTLGLPDVWGEDQPSLPVGLKVWRQRVKERRRHA